MGVPPVVHSCLSGRLAYRVPAFCGLWSMWTARKIIAIVMGIVGVLLIARGVWGGVWPLSVQLLAGIALLAFAVIRWKYYN